MNALAGIGGPMPTIDHAWGASLILNADNRFVAIFSLLLPYPFRAFFTHRAKEIAVPFLLPVFLGLGLRKGRE